MIALSCKRPQLGFLQRRRAVASHDTVASVRAWSRRGIYSDVKVSRGTCATEYAAVRVEEPMMNWHSDVLLMHLLYVSMLPTFFEILPIDSRFPVFCVFCKLIF